MSVLSEAFGVDSLPAGWESSPLHAVATERRGNRNDGLVEENLLSLSYGSIVRKDINSDGGLLPESFEGYQIVEAGDLVMRLTDLQNDKRSLRSGLCNERGIITSAYLALEPRGLDPRYFAYLMRAYDTAKVFYPLGGGLRQSLKYEDIRMLPVLVPPVEEQRRIADFLDDQVARIDGLVVGRNTQLDLVTERRIAALDSMLRTIPGDFVQLRRILRPRQSMGHENETILSLYRDIGIVPKADRSDNFNKTPEDLSRYQLVLKDDFVVNKMKAWSGSVAVSDRRGIVSPDYQVCEIIGDVSPRYLHHMMRSARTVNEMQRLSRGIRPNQERLYWDDLGSIRIPAPTRDRQNVVAEEIDTVVGAFEDQRAPFLESIRSLEERKRSLITAAVTGNLDVTTAKPIGMGRWLPSVTAKAGPATATSLNIGGA